MDHEHARRMYAFQQIRQVPITAVLDRYRYLQAMKRSGTQLVGCCPIYRGTSKKAFVIDPHKNVWKCFGDCEAGGSVIELVSALEKVDARAAADLIARWFAVGSISSSHHIKRRRQYMAGEKPSHRAYLVEERESRDAFWHPVGSAWPHGDGKGLQIQLPPGLAVSGRIVLREYSEDAKEEDPQPSRRKK